MDYKYFFRFCTLICTLFNVKVLQTKFFFANNFFLTYTPTFVLFGQKCGFRSYTFVTLVLKINFSFRTKTHGPEEEYQLRDHESGSRRGISASCVMVLKLKFLFGTMIHGPEDDIPLQDHEPWS